MVPLSVHLHNKGLYQGSDYKDGSADSYLMEKQKRKHAPIKIRYSTCWKQKVIVKQTSPERIAKYNAQLLKNMLLGVKIFIIN